MSRLKHLAAAALAVCATPSLAHTDFAQDQPGSSFAIPDFSLPYSLLNLTFTVSGLGAIDDVNLTLGGLSHDFASDVGVALSAPNGKAVLLMTDVGSWSNFANTDLTFDQQAGGTLPAFYGNPLNPLWSLYDIPSGTVRPSTHGLNPIAWLLTDGNSLNLFNGDDPNGIWTLWVWDDKPLHAGTLGGATLSIDAARLPAPPVPEPATWAMMIGGFALAGVALRRRRAAVSFA